MNLFLFNANSIKVLALSSLLLVCSCNACTVRLLLASPMTIKVIQLVGKAGKIIRESAVGYLTEKAIDQFIAWLQGEEPDEDSQPTTGGIEVIPFADNPLIGLARNNYSIKIHGVRADRESATSVRIRSSNLIFERLDRNSEWVLTMESQRLINRYSINGCAQLSLRDLGYDPKGIDGILGKNTERAIKKFQEDYGLPISGELDQGTIAALLGDNFLNN